MPYYLFSVVQTLFWNGNDRIGLPGVDGYELARMLKQHPQLKSIRLVAHTGYGSPEDRRKAHAAGFDAHLVKPAELDDLEKALQG